MQIFFYLIAVFSFCRGFVLKKCPIILEIDTYRFCTHSARDGKDFRESNELLCREKSDPLNDFKDILKQFISEKEILNIEDEICKKVDMAAKTADMSEEPPDNLLYTNVLIV